MILRTKFWREPDYEDPRYYEQLKWLHHDPAVYRDQMMPGS